MAKRTIKLNIKLPAGVVATTELVNKVTKAAKEVIDASVGDLVEAKKLAKQLAQKGIAITAEEILARKGGTPKASASKKTRATTTKAKKKSSSTAGRPRKRVVLTAAQRKTLIAELKAGAKIAAAAKKYGISTATVMNIKTSAGLTKTRKK